MPPKPKRENWTCLVCYEGEAINIPYDTLPMTFDNRSVEARVHVRCPRCGYEVKFKL